MKRKKYSAEDELAWMKDPFFFNKRMNELVSKLKALPYADDIRVFGSAARGNDKPGDIDLFIDLRGKGKHGAWTELLALAREYYGSLDPFIIADAGVVDDKPTYQLWARNAPATGWTHSRNPEKMLENMEKQGVPLSSVKTLKTASAGLGKYTPEQIEAEAEAWEGDSGACGYGSPGYGQASDFNWTQVDNFPVDKIEDSRISWAAWWKREKEMAEGENHEGYYEAMENWWTSTPDLHVILAEGTNGRYYVWDGTHRVAISKISGMKTVPAFVGTRKKKVVGGEELQDRELDDDYEEREYEDDKTAAKTIGPVYFYIEVPHDSRAHFWEEPPEGNLEFWAFDMRPRAFVNEKIIFTFDKRPVAEARIVKIEEPGVSKCNQTGKFERYWKVVWHPNSVKKYSVNGLPSPIVGVPGAK